MMRLLRLFCLAFSFLTFSKILYLYSFSFSWIHLNVSFQWYCREQHVKKLLKTLWKTSMVESNFEWNFRTAWMELYKNWTLLKMCFEIYSASKKLHIVFCIILYPVSRVNFFNVKHLVVRKIYVAFYTQRYSHVS